MVKPPSVLVVDDDPEMRSLVLDVLRREGYEVAEANDGTEVLRAIQVREINVVLMDKNLPGLSGLELLPTILSARPGIRIIMMTAFGDVPSYVEAVEQGAMEYLFKPFQMEELSKAIRKALEQETVSRV